MSEQNTTDKEKDDAEKDKIGFMEAYLVIAFALVTDVFEIAAAASIGIIVGVVLAPIVAVFGYMVSMGLTLWAMLRITGGGVAKKKITAKLKNIKAQRVVISILGGGADAILLSVLPIRTIAMVVLVVTNNLMTNKNIKKIVGVKSKIQGEG